MEGAVAKSPRRMSHLWKMQSATDEVWQGVPGERVSHRAWVPGYLRGLLSEMSAGDLPGEGTLGGQGWMALKEGVPRDREELSDSRAGDGKASDPRRPKSVGQEKLSSDSALERGGAKGGDRTQNGQLALRMLAALGRGTGERALRTGRLWNSVCLSWRGVSPGWSPASSTPRQDRNTPNSGWRLGGGRDMDRGAESQIPAWEHMAPSQAYMRN